MIKPLGARVVVRRDKPEDKTINGLIIHNDNAPKNTGEVLAIGKDCKELKIGDKVLFNPYIVGEYEDLLIVKEEEFLAILDK